MVGLRLIVVVPVERSERDRAWVVSAAGMWNDTTLLSLLQVIRVYVGVVVRV